MASSVSLILIASLMVVCVLFGLAVVCIEVGLQSKKGLAGAILQVFVALLKNPLVVAPLLGAAWALGGAQLPAALDEFLRLLGAATVLVMASGTGLISVFYQGRARLNMMAKQGMAIEAGGVIMLAAGGFLAGISWYLPFSLYLIAWFFILPVIAFVPRPPADIRTADVHADKTIPLSLKLVYFAAMMSLIVFFSAVILLPFKLQQLHFSSAETGYFLSFLSFVAVIAAALMPKASRTLGEYQTLILAFGLYTIGQTIFNFSDSLFTLIAGACFTGFGFGFSVPLVNHMTVEQSHPQHRGRMLAYLSMAVFSGQFLSSFMEMLPCGLGLVAAAYLAALSGVFIFMSHRAIRK